MEITALKNLNSHERARKQLERLRWHKGVTCPKCELKFKIQKRKNDGCFRCLNCKFDFTVKTGSILENSKVPLHKWLTALAMAKENRLSSIGLSEQIGVTQKTAWLMVTKIKKLKSNKGGNDFLLKIFSDIKAKSTVAHLDFFENKTEGVYKEKINKRDKNCDWKNNEPVIFSFFAGAGFLDLGFEKAGFEVGFVNEYHEPFMSAYKYSRKSMKLSEPRFGYYSGDIADFTFGSKKKNIGKMVREVKNNKRLVGFIGGPPCPDFSIGGKNKGQHGENGKLSKIYVDLICSQKPDFFVFENVKGLYRTSKHRAFFDQLKTQLREAGYECAEKLINSLEYGAPQDRERIILFGIRKKSIKQSIEMFDWKSYASHPEKSSMEVKWPEKDAVKKVRNMPNGIIPELTVQYWFDKNKVESHPNAKDQFTPRAGLAKFKTVLEGDDSKKSYKRLHRWRYSPTAAYGNNEVHIHPYLPRRISVAEALAIQSLPKEFVLPAEMSLSNMFKTVGNGVPFVAANALALSIRDFLSSGLR